MFVLALIASIIIGYILKGKLQNLADIKLKYINLIFIGFIIEFGIILLIQNKILTASLNTYLLDIVMYVFIFSFVILNKKNPYIVIMGIGFLLNAIAIFSNGGTMPVSQGAVEVLGFSNSVNNEGLYSLIGNSTRFALLGDIIPIDFIGRFIVSIGDIIAAIGMSLLIITGMKRTKKDQ